MFIETNQYIFFAVRTEKSAINISLKKRIKIFSRFHFKDEDENLFSNIIYHSLHDDKFLLPAIEIYRQLSRIGIVMK